MEGLENRKFDHPVTLLNEYQNRANETAIYPMTYSLIYPALKLNGEAGEVAEKIGKALRGDVKGGFGNAEFRDNLALELGDVLWYVAALCNDLGISLSDVANMNLEKLAKRQAEGKLKGSGDNR